mmetsp:Transcript_13207/g.11687  ORF Transcript_13207/g.11687 Transcript_13207/m.11687 type:complete len:243 (+) Transcript_13207:337-1065(+)
MKKQIPLPSIYNIPLEKARMVNSRWKSPEYFKKESLGQYYPLKHNWRKPVKVRKDIEDSYENETNSVSRSGSNLKLDLLISSQTATYEKLPITYQKFKPSKPLYKLQNFSKERKDKVEFSNSDTENMFNRTKQEGDTERRIEIKLATVNRAPTKEIKSRRISIKGGFIRPRKKKKSKKTSKVLSNCLSNENITGWNANRDIYEMMDHGVNLFTNTMDKNHEARISIENEEDLIGLYLKNSKY